MVGWGVGNQPTYGGVAGAPCIRCYEAVDGDRQVPLGQGVQVLRHRCQLRHENLSRP